MLEVQVWSFTARFGNQVECTGCDGRPDATGSHRYRVQQHSHPETISSGPYDRASAEDRFRGKSDAGSPGVVIIFYCSF